MAKVKTPEELHLEDMKKSYSDLVELNQYLKNIASVYYIHYDGVIYMKALVEFTDVLVHLNGSLRLEPFYGCMILPNKLFEFKKEAKKSSLVFHEEDPSIIKMEDTKTNISIDINKVNLFDEDPEKSMEYVNSRIKPEMYKKFFEIDDEKIYTQHPQKDVFHQLTKQEVYRLYKQEPLYVNLYNEGPILITRNLMLDIKEDDSIWIARRCEIPVDGDAKKVFFMIKHDTNYYTSYTIFNCLM